jgi:hypothetical protein
LYHTGNPFLLYLFLNRVSHFLPSPLILGQHPPTYFSCVAGITGVKYHVWLVC